MTLTMNKLLLLASGSSLVIKPQATKMIFKTKNAEYFG